MISIQESMEVFINGIATTKWLVVETHGSTMALLGRYETKEEAYNSAMRVLRQQDEANKSYRAEDVRRFEDKNYGNQHDFDIK